VVKKNIRAAQWWPEVGGPIGCCFFGVIKIWVGLGVSSKNHRKMEVLMGKP
jgi:hypothetical protein